MRSERGNHGDVQYLLPGALLDEYFAPADVDELLDTYALRPVRGRFDAGSGRLRLSI